MQVNYSRRVGVSYLWTAAECRLSYLNVEANEILADDAHKRLMRTPVPERFMHIVKRNSRTPEAVEFDPDAAMASLGLESLALVNLLISIEEEYGIVFPQQLVRPAVFATPGKLWDSLRDFLVEENSGAQDS